MNNTSRISRISPFRTVAVTAVATLLAVGASTAFVATGASAATAGQLCASSKAGAKDGALTCTKDGSRFRWTAGGAAPAVTKAPKAAKTTKAAAAEKTTKAAKSSSSPSPKAPAAPSTPGQPVNGRFCAKADSGKRGTDNKGQSLTCSADKNGKFRWQK
jgi:hypothetical protein